MTLHATKSVITYSTQLYQVQEIFRIFWGISIFRSCTNLRTQQLWDTNLFPTAVYSPKQAEKWPQVREAFHDECKQLLHHKRSVHVQDNMWCTGPQQRQIYVSTDDCCFAKH